MRSFALFFSLLLPLLVCGKTPLSVSLQITDEHNTPLANAQIDINGSQYRSDSKGIVDVQLTNDPIITFNIEMENYYSRFHTFSKNELVQVSKDLVSITMIKMKEQRVMLAFGGDVMMGRRYYQPYFDDEVLINDESNLASSKAIVAQMKPYLSLADIAAVNLESQIAEQKPQQRAPKSVTFYSKPPIIDALMWAGIDYVTLGNNHTYDYLDQGLDSTLTALDNAGLPYSGAGKTEQHALSAHTMLANKSSFAMLGYVGWQGSSSPKQTATHQHGGAAFGSEENIVSGVLKAKENNQFPIVQYHGSLEYKDEPTGVTEQRLKSALDNGAKLAVAHHPHVTQGIELYNNKLIAYSMGNFIFDQNFSATQHSYVLYVWLDEGNFIRAEIVPVYVKGYKPTPAIDAEREAILKRVKTLSAKRNTEVKEHFGHGLITPKVTQAKHVNTMTHHIKPSSEKVIPLNNVPWQSVISSIGADDQSIRYRLGTNLINGSDFENFNEFESDERGFIFDKAVTSITQNGYKSNRAISLNLNNENGEWFGMKHFRRVYNPSNPVTLKSFLKVNSDATVKVYWQGRKTRQKLFDAFENSPKNLIKSIDLIASDDWQNIEIDFNSPRIGYRSYRVLIEIIPNQANTDAHILIDDFALVEWQTAFQSTPLPNYFNDKAKMASYIGFTKVPKKPVTITSTAY